MSFCGGLKDSTFCTTGLLIFQPLKPLQPIAQLKKMEFSSFIILSLKSWTKGHGARVEVIFLDLPWTSEFE